MKVHHHRRGIRLEQNGAILSELPAQPGPTHSIFDVLTAAVALWAPGPEVAMLGFAGGGMVAALRAMGGEHTIHAVDLEVAGYELFNQVAREWAGDVRFTCADAEEWLRSQRRRFHAIVEDLSIPQEGEVMKPALCWTTLPKMMSRRLRSGGLMVTNVLPTTGVCHREWEEACVNERGVEVSFDEYENRILIQGAMIDQARAVGRSLRQILNQIGSEIATGIRVRSL